MNIKLSAGDVCSLLEINSYGLSKLRESGKILFNKVNKTKFEYELNEDLKKEFLQGSNIDKDSSLSSDPNNVEMNLTDDSIFSEYNNSSSVSFSYNSRAKNKVLASGIRDNYIRMFRKIALRPKVSGAIEEIVNEMITPFEDGDVIKLDFNNKSDIGDVTKTAMSDAFDKCLNLLDFRNTQNELITDWYIAGRLVLETTFNNKRQSDGIQNILKLNPIGFNMIQDKKNKKNNKKKYVYTNSGTNSLYYDNSNTDIYSEEQIVLIGSGLWDDLKLDEVSYLRIALKAINDIQHIENAIIKYRLTRSVERNVWNVDVGNMAVTKAKNHLASVKQEISSDLKYDTETGNVNMDPSEGITDDWIFPARNGKQKTSVDTIGGNGDFISKLEDLEYFRRELYEALKIPVGRLDGDSTLDYSAQDILREELKFTKFTTKLRNQFNKLFKELIKRELVSTKKISEDDFYKYQNDILFKWNESNVIVENAKIENIKTKIETVSEIMDSGVVGKFISNKFIIENILDMTEEDYKEQLKQIEIEKKQGQHKTEEEE